MELIPNPVTIFTEMLAFFGSAASLAHLGNSILRVLVAIFVGSVFGFSIGAASSSQSILGKFVSAANSSIRYIPPTAFIGLLVIIFGIGGMTGIALIVIGITPYIAIMTADAFRSVPKEYVEISRVFGASSGEIWRLVMIPFARSRIVEAIRVNIGAAWTFLVVAEIIAGANGLGYLIARAQRFGDIQQLYMLILVCGLVGVLMDSVFRLWIMYERRWAGDAKT